VMSTQAHAICCAGLGLLSKVQMYLSDMLNLIICLDFKVLLGLRTSILLVQAESFSQNQHKLILFCSLLFLPFSYLLL
jgi:hypothetical protein